MKIIKKLNIKKIFRSLKSGVLSTNIFFFLLTVFFSTLALAVTLTVTPIDHRIPSGVATGECFSSSRPDIDLDHDRTEDPRDVVWSDDGTMVFTINADMDNNTAKGSMGDLDLSMNKVAVPFELKTVKTIPDDSFPHTCDDIDGFDVDHEDFRAQGMTNTTTKYRGIHIAQGGRIFYILGQSTVLHRFNLGTSFDFKTARYANQFDIPSADGDSINGFSISKDGTRLFTVDEGADADTPVLRTYSLSPAFDITSATEIHSVDLFDIGLEDTDGLQAARDIEFSSDGGEMFISVLDAGDFTNNGIYIFSLGKNYDVSTQTYLGFHKIVYPDHATGSGTSWGFSFSSNGMKLFVLQLASPASRVDQIHQFDLECPYGLIKCSSDASSSIEAQFELAKQNISLNVNTIFKRFEWIKRNRDDENLSAHNFKINYEDPLLKTLANKFEPSVRNNVASFISKHKTENKKSKWSSWSLADISLSIFENDGSVKAKDLNTRGITLGTDRKFGDNKFFGLALRYGDSSSDIKFSKQDVTMESLTLNLYGILPSKDNQYINAVLGLSHLWYDHRYMGNLSGERKGKQAFATINYRTKEKYGIFNVTPTGKLTYGVTRLSEFTDFLAKASGLPTRDVIYKEDTFTSGELAAGFLFETDIIETDQGTVQPMGGIEILYDLTSDVDYKYVYQGGTHVNKETIHSPFSRQNLKTSLGFEAIYLNGFTVSTEYQRIIRLNDTSEAPGFSTDTFIIKFSRSKEEDNQFALNYDPINAHQTNLSYSKNIHGLDFKINSNQSLEDSSEYFTNLEVSGKF
ncbi:autotransporter outer membrane beta-barrel domain-containing protein [bacterium]|nr:autotransporter outer membrane beta-barrel domain-containing protein [bacterium]